MFVQQERVNKCPFVVSVGKDTDEKLSSLMTQLESLDVKKQIESLKKVISIASSGLEDVSSCAIPIIKFCFSSPDKYLKRLCLLFWEIFWSRHSSSSFSDETLLVCNRLLQDLESPNEFIRCATLRLLCSFQSKDVIEMLKGVVKANLGSSDNFVRRNAVMAVTSLINSGSDAFADVDELIFQLLQREEDEICRRNCFAMLSQCSIEKCLLFLSSVASKLCSECEFLQLEVIGFIRNAEVNVKTCSFYRKCLLSLLDSTFSSVVFESAVLLLRSPSLNLSLSEIQTCLHSLVQILNRCCDSNAKVFILRHIKLCDRQFPGQLSPFVTDFVKSFSSADSEVKKISLDILISLLSFDNREAIVELLVSLLAETARGSEFHCFIIEALCKTATLVPETIFLLTSAVIQLCDERLVKTAEKPIIDFLRSAALNESSRAFLISTLTTKVGLLGNLTVLRNVFWLLCEFSLSRHEIESSLDSLLSLYSSELGHSFHGFLSKNPLFACAFCLSLSKLVLKLSLEPPSDGSENTSLPSEKIAPSENISSKGDDGVASSLEMGETAKTNKKIAEVLLVLLSILRTIRLDNNSQKIVSNCLRLLSSPSCSSLHPVFASHFRLSFENVSSLVSPSKTSNPAVSADQDICVPFLTEKNDRRESQFPDFDGTTPKSDSGKPSESFLERISKVKQLTGYQDALYVEAMLDQAGLDLIIEYFVFNKNASPVDNVSIELYSSGSLDVTNSKESYSMEAGGCIRLLRKIKMSSSDGGIIFGEISFSSTASRRKIIRLDSVHLHAVDYLRPTTCERHEFAEMWAQFEWENKIDCKNQELSPIAFVERLATLTKSQVLTPSTFLRQNDNFLSANLIAKSTFGDLVLLNASLEKGVDGMLSGHVRIRCKNEGVARYVGAAVRSI